MDWIQLYHKSRTSKLASEFRVCDSLSCCLQARKNLHRLRGTVRFQVMTQGDIVRKQASTTLSYIHAWSRIQAQISARRHCMAQEGRVRQKKLENQLKLEAKLHELEVLTTITVSNYIRLYIQWFHSRWLSGGLGFDDGLILKKLL